MAEIALIASVVGIAGAGAKLSIALYQIASTIGNAGNEVETIAREFNLFSSALLHLSEAYGLDTAVSDTARRITEDLVSVCDTILEDGKKLLETLKPLTERVESRTKQVILRIRWLFQKSKFATLRKSLESLKGTLTLHVTTLSYTDKRSRNTSETTKYIRFAPPNSGAASNVLTRRFSATFRLNVESCIATVKNDLQGQKNRDILQLMVNHDRDGRRLLMLSTENRTSTSDQENDAASNDDRAPRDGTTLGLDETTGYIQIDETCESSHSGENQLQVARIGSSGDIERGKSDAEDISAVLESYMEIHFLQKRVIRFAQYVLEKPGNAQQSDADKRTTLNPHGHSEKSSHGQDDEGAGSSVLNFPSNEQQGAQIPRQSVIYRDEHNEKYPIPFHSVQTWEGMRNFLLDLYSKASPARNAIHAGEFRLLGPDEQIILPEFWDGVIHPGWTITVRFADNDLNLYDTVMWKMQVEESEVKERQQRLAEEKQRWAEEKHLREIEEEEAKLRNMRRKKGLWSKIPHLRF